MTARGVEAFVFGKTLEAHMTARGVEAFVFGKSGWHSVRGDVHVCMVWPRDGDTVTLELEAGKLVFHVNGHVSNTSARSCVRVWSMRWRSTCFGADQHSCVSHAYDESLICCLCLDVHVTSLSHAVCMHANTPTVCWRALPQRVNAQFEHAIEMRTAVAVCLENKGACVEIVRTSLDDFAATVGARACKHPPLPRHSLASHA